MMTAASRREFDVLVFLSLDQVNRTGALIVLNLFEQLQSYGVQYRSLMEPYLDSAGPFADVFISLLASIAKLERQKISERILASPNTCLQASPCLLWCAVSFDLSWISNTAFVNDLLDLMSCRLQ
jgi:Resolvase, N terminal domain